MPVKVSLFVAIRPSVIPNYKFPLCVNKFVNPRQFEA